MEEDEELAEEPVTSEAEAKPAEARPRTKRRRTGKGGAASRNAQHWMVVSSPDNFQRTRERGFTIQGIKSRHKRRVESMAPGDRLLYYVTGRMAFAATVTVTSPMYEDHTLIWRTDRREEDYPYRFHIRLDAALDEPDWVIAKEIAYRLDYVRKWPPEHWTLAFQGHLHQLPKNDFKMLEDEILRLQKKQKPPKAVE